MNSLNPFRPVKFEDESLPLLCISDGAMRQFTKGNYYFTGKRGCGKTSTLKIADTEFQLEDHPQNKVIYRSHAKSVFGVYLNINRQTIPSFSRVRHTKANRALLASKQSMFQVTSEFLELRIARAVLSSLSRLVTGRWYSLPVEDEKLVCRPIAAVYRLAPMETLEGMIYAIEERLREIIDFAHGLTPTLRSFESRLEVGFHSALGQAFSVFRKANDLEFMRVMLDDCEVFDITYQRAINTLIRAPEGYPISWSVAYVEGMFDYRGTLIPNQTAAREERTVVYLDRQPSNAYRKFIQEVTSLRVKNVEGDKVHFNVAEKLSSFDVNELIAASFKGTKNKRALSFIAGAKRRASQHSEHLPLYEYYLELRGFDLSALTPDAIRKKNVAAYVLMCAEYGLNLKYGGAGVILSLSDGCVRDYLENMASIYDEAVGNSPTKRREFFSSSALSLEVQNKGCIDASKRKLDSIRDYTEVQGHVLEKLVTFLGVLVHRVQSQAEGNEPLRNPDRAVFGLQRRLMDEEFASELELVKLGEVDGYLREVEVGSTRDHYCFRLHRQFAPLFSYSYREDDSIFVPVHPGRIREVKSREFSDPQRWAQRVYEDWRANEGQGELL